MVQWSDSFWGESNRGFDILSSNIKNGAIAIEEFQRFLNESAQCESTYFKNLSRLQSQFLKIQHVGTFTPIWNLMRDLLDKISSIHLTTVNFYQDLLHDIHNYQELYQKKVKGYIQKDGDINRTADLITQLNNSLNTVNKAKEQYYSIALDYERTKHGGNHFLSPTSSLTTQDNNSPSLAQSAINSITSRQNKILEKKYRQAQDEYKLTIEKYNLIRNDYEKRFSDAATKFQSFEIDHIEKMLVFSLNYSDILQRNNEQIRIVQNEFNEKLKFLTGNEILDAFVEQKKTGFDRPAVLQFEELDHLKTPDLSTGQDDFNLINQSETSLPSFQAHFSIPSPNAKQTDNHRGLSTHSISNDPTISPPINTTTSINPMISNRLSTRSQEGNNGNEQTSNPFDLKINKKSKLPAIFGSNRKDKMKKSVKKPLTNIKSNKMPPMQHSRDESNGNSLQNSNYESNDFISMTDNNDDYNQTPSIDNKSKSPTSEGYAPSSPSFSNEDINRHPFPSSKTTSSSDTSDDDDDDNLMTKIFVKINQPKTQILSDEDDDEKIMKAMHLIGKNIGNLVTNPRASSNKTSDINKSISSGQIGTRILPPPIASRSAANIQNSVTGDNVDHSNMFPLHDEFAQLSLNSNNQENLSRPSRSTSGSKNTTSVSSNDDDGEVANSFPTNDWTNKIIPFPILQVPPLFQSNQQQTPIMSSISPSITSFNISPTTPNDIGISLLNIGAMDQIPLAIAFQETIHVMMFGDNEENWKKRIVGQMLISFPNSMLNLFIDSSRTGNTLEFRLKNLDKIENIVAKPSLIIENELSTDSDELVYSFDMTELNNILRNLQEKNSSSLFFNLNVLNYELKQSNISNIPIEISSQWTRTFDTISVNIKYHFNSLSLPDSIQFTNNTVIIYTIITDAQQIKESSPTAEWTANEHKLSWKVPYIKNGMGSLSAIMMTMQTDTGENEQPLTTSSIVKAHFIGENALFSTIDFDLISRGYRISLLKKKILSGKYQSEPDQSQPVNFFKRPSKSPPTDT